MVESIVDEAKRLLIGFKRGDRVVYIPMHADGDRNHKDCEHGIVSSITKKYVFVKYDRPNWIKTDPDESVTAQATSAEDLVLE